ncbi:MAG: hypothetical protein ACRDD1_13630 [Planctomycetia bacterium]
MGEFVLERRVGPRLGRQRVEIRSYRNSVDSRADARPTPDVLAAAPTKSEVEQVLPRCYNEESVLSAEIKPTDNLLAFKLKRNGE